MDIVSRLKLFMGSRKLASTQLADISGIPRPTVSQILNGRNKKISDELITKIHKAFPDLSILWLMFGEGDMEISPNIEFSEHQIDPQSADPTMQGTDNQGRDLDDDLFFSVNEKFTEKFSGSDPNENLTDNGRNFHSPDQTTSLPEIENQKLEETATLTYDSSDSIADKIATANSRCDKKIMNIVVLYDDGTFETFKPA